MTRARILSFHRSTVLGLALLGLTASQNPARADTPALRPVVTVTAATLRVGDLFTGAGVHAGEVVGMAPAPGTTTVLDSSWLSAAAQAHGLSWSPPDESVSTQVTRAAATIDQAEIAHQLARRLAPSDDKAQVVLDGAVHLFVPVGGSGEIGIENIDLDAANGRFDADLRAPAGDLTVATVHVSGRLKDMLQVPVLSRPMMPGDVVGAQDITWISVDVSQLPPGQVMDASELIGHTPRHPLRAGVALRPVDLEVPLLVHRNDAVMIVLEAPGMSLTAEGRALDNGGKGELIRVVNIQSNRMIDATVLDMGEVGIAAPGAIPPVL